MNRTIYLPHEKSNFKRFAFYSSLQTYHNVSSQNPNYTSEEAYIMARNYILSNLTKTIKGDNSSELSAYQQALNLLKAMADNELAKERRLIADKLNDPLIPEDLKKAIRQMEENFDYMNFIRILNQYYSKTTDLNAKIDSTLNDLKIISNVVTKAYARYRNFQGDYDRKLKRTILRIQNPKTTNFFINGSKKENKKARIAREDGALLGKALKNIKNNTLTLADLDRKAYNKIVNKIQVALNNSKYFQTIFSAIQGNSAAKNNIIKILDYLVMLFYQDWLRSEKREKLYVDQKEEEIGVDLSELLDDVDDKAEKELTIAVEKALDFFSENVSIIESMSKELLGESQSVADFANSKKQRYQEIEALGNQLGISGLITRSGALTKSKRKENQLKTLVKQGNYTAQKVLNLMNAKRTARPKGYGNLSVQGEISQVLESGFQYRVINSIRKGQHNAKDDTLTFHLIYTPPDFLIEEEGADKVSALNTALKEKTAAAVQQIEAIAQGGSMNTKELKQRFSKQNKIYADLEKDLNKIKEQLGLSQENLDIFVEHGTTKEYSFLNNSIGFSAGAIGENNSLISAIENINLMADKGGISFADKNWLIFSAMNCAKHLVGGDLDIQSPLENYLSLIAGALMFEDSDKIMQEVSAKVTSKKHNSIQHIHIYRLNSYYFPLSFILTKTWESLNQLSLFLEDAQHSGNQVHIINNSYWKNFSKQEVTEKTWREEGKDTLNATTITMTFMAGFLDILEDLKIITP